MTSPVPAESSPMPTETAPAPRVLVVDDVDANLAAVRALLGEMRCEVVVARSGNEALRQLLKVPFAVMLLDVQMPEMDGYEVARHARANPVTRDVPILFLTAMNNTEDGVLRGYGSGAIDIIFKPLNAFILRSKVAVFLELFAERRRIAVARDELARTNEKLAKAYGDLQSAQAQLIQSAKMASLGELVAGIAHEINNPLAFALSHLDTARRSLATVSSEVTNELPDADRAHWERAQNRLGEMRVGLDRIRELIVKLRTFSRLDEGEYKTVVIPDCVESVLTILRHRLTADTRIETNYGEPKRLECYPGLLNQAIMNVVSNAIDAVDGAGTVTIHTGATGTEYRIVVTDTGPGIPTNLRERVFEPFFTTKPVGQGTGLGLAITYSIIEKHGGAIEIGTAEGGGTAIAMKIPIVTGAK
jgi:two-component system NtrC family sensor kinase